MLLLIIRFICIITIITGIHRVSFFSSPFKRNIDDDNIFKTTDEQQKNDDDDDDDYA